jgi:hypothetical protein
MLKEDFLKEGKEDGDKGELQALSLELSKKWWGHCYSSFHLEGQTDGEGERVGVGLSGVIEAFQSGSNDARTKPEDSDVVLKLRSR